MNYRASQRGFTIIELLVVIVVIAILATITLVAYNGITTRAHIAVVESDLRNSSNLLEVYNSTNGSYPANLATANLPTGDGTTYQYTVNNGSSPATFCLTATNNNISYYINNTSITSPTAGGCPGDGVNGVAAVTNLILNPSIETDTTNLEPYDSAPITRDTTTAAYGTSSALVTTNTTAYPQGIIFPLANGAANATYTCSMSLKGTVGQAIYISGRSDSSTGYQGEGYGAVSLNLSSSWQRITTTFTTPSGATTVYVQARFNLSQSGMQAWVDGVFCTESSSTYNYADGNSPNWIWNGTTNDSTSTGPPQ